MSDKQFILGVGCQKGGTTWLHNQISKNRHVDMGFRKEYHVFDAIYVPECSKFMGVRLTKSRMLGHALRAGSVMGQIQPLLKSANFRKHPANYFKYFDALSRPKHITTVGDFSPSYCALPIEAFRLIKKNLEELGFVVKIVFLMRDPVQRCWSAVRMDRRKRPELSLQSTEEEYLRNAYRAPGFQIRTQYENTIRNLETVFDRESILYEFYERLFTPEVISKIVKFLDIPDLILDVGAKLNVSPKNNGDISDGLCSDIHDFYRETYEFCFDRFGVEELWFKKPGEA